MVEVARVRTAPSGATVEIPGQTVALLETPIYARTDGYIRQRNVEIGDRVKKGQLLMELDTPDLDQQIEQARATLAQSKAALSQVQASLIAAAAVWRWPASPPNATKPWWIKASCPSRITTLPPPRWKPERRTFTPPSRA